MLHFLRRAAPIMLALVVTAGQPNLAAAGSPSNPAPLLEKKVFHPISHDQIAAASPAKTTLTGAVADPASVVNTLVMSSGGPNTFPGADVPFGMIQWSPDTAPSRPSGGGYDYGASQIRGFSLMHLSGPGCDGFGDLPILPLTGGQPSAPGSQMETFSHSGEMGNAGYYTVMSGSPAIKTELTETLHSGMARFTFPATSQADVLIKLRDSENGVTGSSANIISSTEVSGSDSSGSFCGGGDRYTVNFDLAFDRPFTSSHVIMDPTATNQPNSIFLTFDTTSNPVLQAKVGISFVSTANARLNWQMDNPSWSFGNVQQAAHNMWNAQLGKIAISGGTSTQQQLFYSELYKALIHPNVVSDVNGQYMGFDHQAHQVSPGQHDQYGNYSGWDIYRSQAQLSALLAPQQMSDSAQSMLNDAAQNSGQLPKWATVGGETYVMVGDPGTAILADYYAFGARSFDTHTALQVALNEANHQNNVRPGLTLEQQHGYIPDDLSGSAGCCNFYGSLSTLLEYDIADAALAMYAGALGDPTDQAALLKRAQNWVNVVNSANDFLNTKESNGSYAPITPTSFGPGYVEGTAAQYRWLVPFNQSGLASALGGDSVVNPLLDHFFSQLNPNADDTAALHNEVDIGMPYFYDWTGQPWKTQEVNNRHRNQIYSNQPNGFPDNDDLGAMSAVYVWASLGVYPATPGSADLMYSSPQFSQAVIQLPSGKTLTINAPQASASDFYVQSLDVNGSPSNQLYLPASALSTGATLDFTLGSSPSTWGSGSQNAPPVYSSTGVTAVGFTQPAGQIVISPGATASASVGAQSLTSGSQTVNWTTAPPPGVSVSPSSGSVTVAGGSSATQPISIRVGTTEGTYPVVFHLTGASGAMPDLTVTVYIARPGELWPYYDNTGISDDTSRSANFDGGGASYSVGALAGVGIQAGGTVTTGGMTFTWPNVPADQPDNIRAAGQTIAMPPTAGGSTVGILGAAENGNPGSQGHLVVNYSDGTHDSVVVGLTDWTRVAGAAPISFGNSVAATMSTRNNAGTLQTVTTYLFETNAAVNPSKTIVSLTLPSDIDQGGFQIFALSLSGHPTASPTPVPITAPGAPTNITVTPSGAGQASISWTAPTNDGGAAINFYAVYLYSSTGSASMHVAAAPGPDVESDLTPKTYYTATATAWNGQFWGAWGGWAPWTLVTASSPPPPAGGVDLSSYFNNSGISDDATPTSASLDTGGFSFSEQALTAAGLAPGATVSFGGQSFTWPNVAPGQSDNVVAMGQSIALSSPSGATTLAFLGTGTNGDASGQATVSFADGTSQTFTLTMGDWAGSGASPDQTAAIMTYRNSTTGKDPTRVSVFYMKVGLNTSSGVTSIVLPSGVGGLHIFAVAFS